MKLRLRRPVQHLEPSKHQPKDGIYIPYPSYCLALQRFITVQLYNAMNCVGTSKSNLSTKFDSKYIPLVVEEKYDSNVGLFSWVIKYFISTVPQASKI